MPTKRQKGGSYERQVCNALSSWWHAGRSDIFWRTGASGGRATRRGRAGVGTFGQHGDVCAVDPVGRGLLDVFTVEVKRGFSRFTPFDLVDRREAAAVQVFESWVRQASESAGHAGTPLWLIISRRDRRRAVATFPKRLLNMLADRCLPSKNALLAVTPQMRVACVVRPGDGRDRCLTVIIMPLDDFLRALSPGDVLALTE